MLTVLVARKIETKSGILCGLNSGLYIIIFFAMLYAMTRYFRLWFEYLHK